MKKLNLSIPTPCHENWEQMSQAEKGKFCGACQKTVVDFTNMSDRQLVEFFKNPKDNVCGRFNNDQLEREILIPRKRIPWIKYFFQFTWPAFVLGLKSCTNNSTNATRNVKVELQNIKNSSTDLMTTHTLGISVQEIQPYAKPLPVPELITCDANETIGIIASPIEKTEGPEDSIHVGPPLDAVTVVSYSTKGKVSVMGGISSSVVKTVQQADTITVNANTKNSNVNAEQNFLVYPNPINAGAILTVTFPENSVPEKIQLISISGQIIASIEQNISDYATVCNINIPSHVAAGVYFLRLIGKNKILNTSKIVVNK